MAGKITTNSVVLGDSITDTQNFVLKTNVDGTATLARGALGALGTVLTVDASSNVGIGTATPASKLEVAGELRVYPSTTPAVIRFGVSAVEKGKLAVDSSSNMFFETAGTERMRIDAVGNVTLQKNISVGGAAPTTSGSGITFPATQSASSDANTLDDYEEGTWTPSIGGTATYNARWGTYTKVGNLVTVMFNVNILLINSGSTTTLSGLPFLINNPTYGNDQSGVLTYFEQIATSVYTLNCRGTNGASTLFFSGTTASAFAITNVVTVFKNGAILQGGITYQTTS